MRFLKGLSIFGLVLILSIAMVGCGTTDDPTPDPDPQDPVQQESVDIGYVNWACATASSYLVKNVIETELGIEANLHDLDAGVMWQSIATEDVDFIVCAWLPGTHSEYFGQLEDEVVDMGPNYHNAQIGLVVPAYVDIDSIEDLNDHADKFSGQIVGIDSGAGIMGATNNAIEEYDLDLELVASSDAAMTAELRTAIQNDEWIVVTGWSPHWKFADFDLKFLEDPQGIFGGAETINTISRLDFETNNTAVHAFLDNYFMSAEQLGGLIAMMEEYDDNNEAAIAWIEENRDVVDSWLD